MKNDDKSINTGEELISSIEEGELNEKKKIEKLIGIIKSDESEVSLKARAVELLGETGSEEVLPIILELLQKEKISAIAAAAAEALGKINNPSILDHLIEEANNSDPYVRIKVIKAIGLMESPLTVKILLNALKDPNENVRREAARVLRDLNDLTAVPFLIEVLDKDKDWAVRASAAYSLGKLKEKSAISTLADRALNDPISYVREAAIVALGKFDDKNIIPIIEAAQNDKVHFVKRTASEILKDKLKDKQPDDFIRPLKEIISKELMAYGRKIEELKDRLMIPVNNNQEKVELKEVTPKKPFSGYAFGVIIVIISLAIGHLGSPIINKYIPRKAEVKDQNKVKPDFGNDFVSKEFKELKTSPKMENPIVEYFFDQCYTAFQKTTNEDPPDLANIKRMRYLIAAKLVLENKFEKATALYKETEALKQKP